MPEILNYNEFLRNDVDSQARASRELSERGLKNLRKGMETSLQQQQQQQQQQGTSMTEMNENKGIYLEFIDQLSDIQNNLLLLDSMRGQTSGSISSRSSNASSWSGDNDTTVPMESKMNMDDITELGYPTSPHDIDSDGYESDDSGTVVVNPRNRVIGNPLPTFSILMTKTISLTNKSRTFFRINVKPIYNQLNAQDISSINEECASLRVIIMKFPGASKLVEAVANLLETVAQTEKSYVRKGRGEIVGGGIRRDQRQTEFKTAPTSFSYTNIHTKYLL